MPLTLAVRADRLERLTKSTKRTDTDIAAAGGLHVSHYRRVVRGEVRPGSRFIATLIAAFGADSLPNLLTITTNGDR